MVTLTGFFWAMSAWKPEGMAIPAEPECDARYCEKFTPGETEDMAIVWVEFKALMKLRLKVELLSLFWTNTGTDEEPLPEKMAPKSKIRITGKIREKKRPMRLLMKPRPKTVRSALMRLPLTKLESPPGGGRRRRRVASLAVPLLSHKLDEDVLEALPLLP